MPPPVKRGADFWRRFRYNRLAVIGLFIMVAVTFMALAAPILAPHDPDEVSYNILQPPSAEHLLGTDDSGRDVLSRLIYASRVSLAVGVTVSLATVLLGTAIGALAGAYGGMTDTWLSGLINVMLSIPTIPLAMVLGAFLSKDVIFIVGILFIVSWTATARIIRAEFITLRERDYVLAARAIGASQARLILKHMLPNSMPLIIVSVTLGVASAILAESALSYLGYGIQPPTPSWGNMLQNAQTYLRQAPLLAIWPGALIALTVIGINFVGDGLRDALDPRLKYQR
ncbi:MAG: ABC transporter permease [Anaerolineae bacterium]|nr:ABC transporter permease [Anaerolineae bacterium]